MTAPDNTGLPAAGQSSTETIHLIDPADAQQIARGSHDDPFAVLGVHPLENGWTVRAFIPGAERAEVLTEHGTRIALQECGAPCVFAAALDAHPGAYRIEAGRGDDRWEFEDPYRFPPILGDLDEHLISEGTHLRLWTVLGAHPREHAGVAGTSFAVWAPNARRVSVIGDFNQWDGRRHILRRRGATGVWEIFLPRIGDGTRYKYEIIGRDGTLLPAKADPVGFQGELRPGNCSIVRALDHDWRDGDWMARRSAAHRTDSPMTILEVHLASWRRRPDGGWLSYGELAAQLVPYARDMGFTHIEVMPVSEHPFDGSWGYQPVGLFAPTSRFGTLEEFRGFVEAIHAAGLGLIFDWVPAHFPSDPHGLGQFDGTPLYEHSDPREGFHQDWNTLIYNYGRREVANYLIANALYWITEHHVDALRVDAVASMLYRDYSRKAGEWVPNAEGGRENLEAVALLRQVNTAVYGADDSAMTVAEESTAWPGVSAPVHHGGLGFGYKWNMGWMHDTLEYMKVDPLYRRHHHGLMSFGLDYAFSENFILPLSHDEVVHGKGSIYGRMPGERDQKLANLRAYYAFMYAHPGKKMLFMGQEFGQPTEWNHEAGLPWHLLDDPAHKGVQTLVRDLNRAYRDRPALHRRDTRADGFEWIDGAAEAASVYAWLRRGEGGDPPVLAVFNFSGVEHLGWRLGVPHAGRWVEILNTDAGVYGGADRGNLGGVASEPVPSHGHEQSVVLTLPPLSGIYLELSD